MRFWLVIVVAALAVCGGIVQAQQKAKKGKAGEDKNERVIAERWRNYFVFESLRISC